MANPAFVSSQLCVGECSNLQELNISQCEHVTVSKRDSTAFSLSSVEKHPLELIKAASLSLLNENNTGKKPGGLRATCICS